MKIIKNTFVIIIVILFLSCSSSNNNKVNIIKLDALKTNKGWVDIPLSIIKEKKTKDYYEYLVRGTYKNDTLGMTVKLQTNLPAGIVNGELKNVFLDNGIAFVSNGAESNKLLRFIASKYGIPKTNLILKKEQLFNCANLNQSKPDYNKGISRFKIFLENKTESAELFVNFNFKEKIISFNEKDTGYRKPLINLLKE